VRIAINYIDIPASAVPWHRTPARLAVLLTPKGSTIIKTKSLWTSDAGAASIAWNGNHRLTFVRVSGSAGVAKHRGSVTTRIKNPANGTGSEYGPDSGVAWDSTNGITSHIFSSASAKSAGRIASGTISTSMLGGAAYAFGACSATIETENFLTGATFVTNKRGAVRLDLAALTHNFIAH
jgi:hypothetical protein